MKNTILIIDKYQFEREKYMNCLSKIHTFNYIQINDEHQLKTILNKVHNISLIIIDIEFPTYHEGLHIIEKIRSYESFKTIPIIITTKIDDSNIKTKTLQFMVNDYIIKPYKPTRLQNSVKNTIRIIEDKLYSFENAYIINLSVEDYLRREIMLAKRTKNSLSIIYYTLSSKLENHSKSKQSDIMEFFKLIQSQIVEVLRFTDIIITNNNSDIIFILPSTKSDDISFVHKKILTKMNDLSKLIGISIQSDFYNSFVTFPDNGYDLDSLMNDLLYKIYDTKMLNKISSFNSTNLKFITSSYKKYT